MDDKKAKKEIELLKKEKEVIGKKIEDLDAVYNVYVLEENVIINNSFSIGGQEKITAVNLQNASNLYGEKLRQIKLSQLKNTEIKDSLRQRINIISNELRALNANEGNPTGEILVSVNANSNVNTELSVTYAVSGAGWNPKYDVRSKSITKPLELTLKAQIYQNTGSDWKNVKLTVSNADLSKKGIRPILDTWFLDFYNYYSNNYRQPTTNTTYTNTNAPNVISGNVKNNKGEPLPGVSVFISNYPNVGTITDINGAYTLYNVPNNADYLKFDYIGMTSQTKAIYTTNTHNVYLYPAANEIEEVVVTAIGVKKGRKELAYAVSEIDADEDMDYAYTRALEGKVSGVGSGGRARDYKKKAKEGAVIPQENIVQKKETTVEYILEKPYTIPSDNKQHGVDVKTYNIDAEYKYYSAPILDNSVFLTAQIKDRSNYDLLTAKSDLFFEGTYIGEAQINSQVADTVLDFSLGRDNNVYIERKKLVDFTDKKFIAGKKEETFAYEISVRNKKSEELSLKLEDRIPISTNNKIEVEVIEISKAEKNDETGIITWNLKLKPKETKKLVVKYSVKYPDDKFVNLER